MSELVNWEKLKSYNTNQNKSFEELCYQISCEEFYELGSFTSIDDSGGGDGVEFYLKLPNGDIWGWQCKFFGRLDVGGRKEQIKTSLQRAHDKHGSKLKKWILCSKLSMTPNEKDWFESNLSSTTCKGRIVLPQNNSVELQHWGDSVILNLLRKYQDIHRYFFTEKLLEFDWYRKRFEIVSSSSVIKSKYLNGLHVSGQADETVIKILCDRRLADLIEEHKEILDVKRFLDTYEQEIETIKKEEEIHEFTEDYHKVKNLILINNYPEIVRKGNDLLEKTQEVLRSENLESFNFLVEEMKVYQNDLQDFYTKYSELRTPEMIPSVHWDTEENEKDEVLKRKIKSCRDTILGPYFTLRSFMDAYLNIFNSFKYRNLNDLHISGHASKGKTHLATNIIEHQINQNKPAIFIFGKDFRNHLPLKEQLKSLLDLPSNWSVSDFLGALNISGKVNKTKAILLIDGLNESIHWKQIWGSSLEALINEINQNYPNILFITTYRKSYQNQLFPKDYFSNNQGWKKIAYVEGFNRDNIDEAIDKYFEHYKIKIVNSSRAMNHFSEPLYLKIFCEAKRGQKVSFQNEDLFDVFDEYLNKSNIRIIETLGLELKYNRVFTENILRNISENLWKSSRRDLSLTDLIPDLVSEKELLTFEGEDLLIFRDWHKEEIVTFTYDLLSGYLIAKIIVEQIANIDKLLVYIDSEKFRNELLISDSLHPLYNDILRCFSVLIIKKFGLSFYNRILNKTLKDYLLRSIFEVNTNTVFENKETAQNMVREVFNETKEKDFIYRLFKNTELDSNHPLNFDLLSDFLMEMKMSDRDLSWTEYIRKAYHGYSSEKLKQFIENFEEACIENEKISNRIHFASKKIMWFLTSTNLDLRDKATKALYFYGRRFPEDFFVLVQYTLKINDPYIWQRTLASLYGIVLAKHNDWNSPEFKKTLLPYISKTLYELIFSKTAKYGTTNIIARDYVQKIIQISLKHHPNLLNKKEIKDTKPPFKYGGIRDWGEYNYGDRDYGYNEPMRMDFSNYTIGAIVPGGGSYSNPPEKQKVRRQIYWRIYDLGWSSEQFEKAETSIGNDIYHNSRTEKPKVERYGKKYSWIAFYEIYGFREDNNLVKDEWPDFRVSESDIDPTFPLLPQNKLFVDDDFLGDRNVSLIKWYETAKLPKLENYLEVNNLNQNSNDWICLNGLIAQKDDELNRKIFVFVNGIIVKDIEYEEFLKLHQNNDFRNGRSPSVSENYYTYSGEMNTLEEATYSNFKEVYFETSRQKKLVKEGDSGYYPEMSFENGKFLKNYPVEKEIEQVNTKDFEILMPVAQYSWESYHSSVNQAGHQNVLSKEIALSLDLINVPQTFNLHEKNGDLASINLRYYENYNSSQHFVYLRKDLFNKFLKDNNYKFIWSIWGERELHFDGHNVYLDFTRKNGLTGYKNFKEVIPYSEP